MIDYTAFHEEIEKIAQDKDEKEKGHWINKDTLKRLAIVAPVAAAGAGLGHGTGKLIQRAAMRTEGGKRLLTEFAKRHPIGASIGKKLPAIGGGLAAGAAALMALKNKKVQKYLKGDTDEGKRPQ